MILSKSAIQKELDTGKETLLPKPLKVIKEI